jgi:hypothetical protein
MTALCRFIDCNCVHCIVNNSRKKPGLFTIKFYVPFEKVEQRVVFFALHFHFSTLEMIIAERKIVHAARREIS